MTAATLFHDLAVAVDDLHAIAVEGRRSDNSPDMLLALAAHARCAVVGLDCIVLAIAMEAAAQTDTDWPSQQATMG